MTGPEVIERVVWEICPILQAFDESDMPVIIHGPRPECRKCKANDDPRGIAGCLLVATLAIRAALAALMAAVREPEMIEKLAAEVQCRRRTADDVRIVLGALARQLGGGE